MAGAKSKRRAIDGILIFDKPLGMSSNAALQKVRWLFNAAKGGHTGSLDPLATGVLPRDPQIPGQDHASVKGYVEVLRGTAVPGRRVAVIVNDMSEINIDAARIRDSGALSRVDGALCSGSRDDVCEQVVCGRDQLSGRGQEALESIPSPFSSPPPRPHTQSKACPRALPLGA